MRRLRKTRRLPDKGFPVGDRRVLELERDLRGMEERVEVAERDIAELKRPVDPSGGQP